MEYTENYKFREPTPAVDIVKIGDINYNSRKIDELIHSTQVSLAPAYDATRTSENPYMTGDVVMKDALMYKCLEDDVYGAWDATKWARTTAGEEGAGGSNVEANPQGTPTDDLDTIGINGTIYNIAGSGGGGGNVYGAFIDTNRVIQAFTLIQDTQEHTYTATEDCVLVYSTANSANGNTYVKVDNVKIGGQYTQNGIGAIDDYVYLKRGQTFSFQQTYTSSSTTGFTVYGLTFGTQSIFTPQIYSTEEREVGVGANGKPLYQKTFKTSVLSSETEEELLSNVDSCYVVDLKTWTSTGSRAQAPFYISTYSIAGSGTEYGIVIYDDTTNKVSAYNVGRASSIVIETTVQYTKTTDTAGSGLYNTLGVPMVHYTTDEQVVGTYLGETLYQKTFTNMVLSTSGQSFGGYYAEINMTTLIANAENVKFIRGDYEVSNTKRDWSLGMYEPDYHTLYLITSAQRSNVNSTFTIQYTKSSS